MDNNLAIYLNDITRDRYCHSLNYLSVPGVDVMADIREQVVGVLTL